MKQYDRDRWTRRKYRRLAIICVYMKISNFALLRGDFAVLKFRWKMYLEKRPASGTVIVAIERRKVSPTFHLIATRRRKAAFSSYIDFKIFEISIIKGFTDLNKFLSNCHSMASNSMRRWSLSITIWNFLNFSNFFNHFYIYPGELLIFGFLVSVKTGDKKNRENWRKGGRTRRVSSRDESGQFGALKRIYLQFFEFLSLALVENKKLGKICKNLVKLLSHLSHGRLGKLGNFWRLKKLIWILKNFNIRLLLKKNGEKFVKMKNCSNYRAAVRLGHFWRSKNFF